MAVALRGYTQGSTAGIGYSVAWPAGTVAGDLAIVHCGWSGIWQPGYGPQAAGWLAAGYGTWWKIVTASDIASALVVNAVSVSLQVFSGASSVGHSTSQAGVTVDNAGSGVWLAGRRDVASLAPATYRLGTEWADETGRRGVYFVAAGAGYQVLPSAAPDADWSAVELLPATVPAAPLLLAPEVGAHMDRTEPITFSWSHQSPSPQTAYRVRIVGPTTSYLTDAGTLTTTETDVPSTAESATLAASLLADTYSLVWSVATRNGQGWGPYASSRLIYPDSPAVLSVTVTSPAESLAPSVAWSVTSSGVSQGSVVSLSAHRTRITPAASTAPDQGTLWDSGVVHNATSPDVAPKASPWTNGQSLTAWVDGYQIGGVYGRASSAAFTVSWTPPSTPTVTATATSPVVVTVSGLTSGSPVQVDQQIGGVWSLLAATTATGTSLTVSSVLAAAGVSVGIRARQASIVDGVSLWSAWSTTASVTATLTGYYLVDDADRSSALLIRPATIGAESIAQGVAVTYGLGATSACVDYSPTAARRGSLVIGVDSPSERDALVAWLNAHPVWWLALAPDNGHLNDPVRAARVSEYTWEHLVQSYQSSRYLMPLSWVEQP